MGFEDTDSPKQTGLPLLLALEMLRKRIKGIENSEILMVGDSVDKDLPPAKRIGLQTAIAKYGQTKDERNKMADYILENISDLLGIVRSQNPPLHKKLDIN